MGTQECIDRYFKVCQWARERYGLGYGQTGGKIYKYAEIESLAYHRYIRGYFKRVKA